MAKYEPSLLRNVALIGHGSVGKTTLCEALLYAYGKTDRMGKVDDGTSCMDFEPEEQKKHISVSSAFNFVENNKNKINIVDTPGDSNFFFDTMSCLRAVDGTVIVIDATNGVEFQTGKVNECADEYKLPKLIYISRIDRERSNFYHALESISAKLKFKVTPIFIPIGSEADFNGVVDLVNQKALAFSDAKGNFTVADIPVDIADDARKYREAMVEDIAESDESLMEKYLEAGVLSVEDIKTGLRKAVIARNLVPVVCGAPFKGFGVTQLFDAIIDYLPSPTDRVAVVGKKISDGSLEERKPDASSPFSGLVCKTIADPYAGKLTIFRVFSGAVNSDSAFFNSTRKCNERFGSVFFLEGKSQKTTDSLVAGDIAAVAKLKETITGDTICLEKSPIVYESVVPPPAVMSFAIEPKTRGDEEKIVSSINRLIEEDPSLKFYRNDETREMILSGSGQVHIEVTVEKMKRKFSVEVNLKTPKIPYKETIKSKTNIQGKYKKQSGGRGQFGDCWLDIEPLQGGGKFEFADKIVGGVIPQQYRPAVEKGIVEAMAEGVLAGYPMIGVKVSLVDGSY
ncbi:MAG: elongation factor G, partial [Deltaproteobacteria bacterium]